MTKDDSLVRKRWEDWKAFNFMWSHDSYDSLYEYWGYVYARTPQMNKTAIEWRIVYQPDKDNYAFTREFNFHKGKVTSPSISYAPEKTIDKRKREIKGGLKALSEKGLKITNFREGRG